jgi:hypothetical protein
LHDSVTLERLGIPTVAVATDEFRTAARAQAAALSRPDYEAVYVSHPIQDQTRSEIEARADSVVAEITRRLLQS